MDPPQIFLCILLKSHIFSQKVLFISYKVTERYKVHNELSNKLDSSKFQQDANSFIIVYSKTQPLKNGSTGKKMFPQKEMNQIGIDAIDIDFDIPQRIRFTIIMEVFVVINSQ